MNLHVLDHRPLPLSGALNMAWDEVLLETATTPILRFYAWDGPWVSCGYFQNLQDVAKLAGTFSIVRRRTGGGTVFHDGDCTFSLTIPAPHPFAKVRPRDSYHAIHAALSAALRREGIDATLAPNITQPPGRECFQAPVCSDVMFAGDKIAGGAQRRTRQGFLHQGSLRMPGTFMPTLDGFSKELAAILGCPAVVPYLVSEAAESRAKELACDYFTAQARLAPDGNSS